MAHYLTNNEKFHIFSKSPVLSSMAVSQAVNKSGHTVSTNDVWADDVPWFTEVADEAGAITRAADARYNDLILWGSDIYVRKGDKTNGASTGTTFAELWEKHTDLTEARAYALGSVTTQTPTNIVTKTVEIKNASDKVVLKYHVGKQIDLLTTANNANVASTWAARMFIDGKVVDQFVSPTDKVFAGNPSTGYTTLVYTATAAGNKYGFVAEGEADADFVNNAFAGIVQFNQSRNSGHKFAASVFEYVGDKLDATVAKLNAAVFGSNSGGSDQPVDLVTQVNINTGAIATLNGDVNTTGSIAKQISDATKSLAAKSDITINDIKVKVGSGEATSLTPVDKSVTIEIPDAPEADVAADGTVTTDGFTKTAAVTSLAKAAINAATLTRGDNDIQTATGETATKLVTAAQVKEYVDENAKVTLTADTTTGSTGIVIDKNGQEATSFTIGIDQSVIATKKSVDDLSSLVSGLPATIKAAQDTADGAMEEAKKKVASVTGPTTGLVTVTGDKEVTITVSETIATKSDITTEINKLTAADGAITTLSGKVSDIETSLADGGTIHELIDTAQETAENKVEDVTVDGTSVTSKRFGVKTAALTTTKGVAITPSADSTSTALATEASVAKALASITSVGVSYEVIPDGQTHTSITAPVNGRIYLEKDETNAEAGVYIEWMYTEKGWEQIGSTKTDHSSYASTITVNGSPKTVSESSVDLGAFASTVTAGNGVESGSVSNTGALSLTLTTASTETAGISQLTKLYNATEEDKAATGAAIAAAIDTLDSNKSGNGIRVTQTNGVIESVTEELIAASVPEGTTSVEGNVAYVGSAKHVIAPDKFQTAAQMPATLTSWVADLSNLTNGDNMFNGCTGLTVFVGDLSSLTSGIDMFNGCTLDAESLEILAENLPTVSGGTIDIGASTNATEEVIATIKGKGWTVKSNGTDL